MPVKIDTGSMLFEYRVVPVDRCRIGALKMANSIGQLRKCLASHVCTSNPICTQGRRVINVCSRYGHLRMLVRFHVNVLRILLGNHN